MTAKMNGIYIILKRDDDLLLENYNGILGIEVSCRTIYVKGFPKGPLFDPDGIELDLNPKALVKVTYRPDLGGYGFHMANVAPSNPEVEAQYQTVLSKVGLMDGGVTH